MRFIWLTSPKSIPFCILTDSENFTGKYVYVILANSDDNGGNSTWHKSCSVQWWFIIWSGLEKKQTNTSNLTRVQKCLDVSQHADFFDALTDASIEYTIFNTKMVSGSLDWTEPTLYQNSSSSLTDLVTNHYPWSKPLEVVYYGRSNSA